MVEICKRCVMDQSDPKIWFDDEGICNHCRNYDEKVLPYWSELLQSSDRLNAIAAKIRASGIEGTYDCIIGVSGGLDSSYAAHVAVTKMGLRPLLFHVDAGWNTEQAVYNIERLVDGLGLDLYTEVIDWRSVQRLHLAFLKSGIPDQDLVQDAAFFSALYSYARKNNIKNIITGSNFSTECCREPEEWGGYLGIDKLLFKSIWRKHGVGDIHEFPLIDILVYRVFYRKFLGFKVHYPLNMIRYTKESAESELAALYGWKPFEHKHHESRFTRFYEDFWLPQRFGYDKRRAHFSSLIMTDQMSRVDALRRLEGPEMSPGQLAREFEYVAAKLNLRHEELLSLLQSPKRSYKDFANKRWVIGLGAKILRIFGLEKRNIS